MLLMYEPALAQCERSIATGVGGMLALQSQSLAVGSLANREVQPWTVRGGIRSLADPQSLCDRPLAPPCKGLRPGYGAIQPAKARNVATGQDVQTPY